MYQVSYITWEDIYLCNPPKHLLVQEPRKFVKSYEDDLDFDSYLLCAVVVVQKMNKSICHYDDAVIDTEVLMETVAMENRSVTVFHLSCFQGTVPMGIYILCHMFYMEITS